MTDRDLLTAVSIGRYVPPTAAMCRLLPHKTRRLLGTLYATAMHIIACARDRLVTIYGLIANDEPDRIRYVGRAKWPSYRFAQHLTDGNTMRVRAWLNELRSRKGAWAQMVEIERCGARPAWHRELHWIKHYKQIGQADLNVRTVK